MSQSSAVTALQFLALQSQQQEVYLKQQKPFTYKVRESLKLLTEQDLVNCCLLNLHDSHTPLLMEYLEKLKLKSRKQFKQAKTTFLRVKYLKAVYRQLLIVALTEEFYTAGTLEFLVINNFWKE